jgi:UDP-glucuronate 4-epimerase
MSKCRTLVTGAAGFIGFHVCRRLLASGVSLTGIDSLNDYYSVKLKRDRLAELQESNDFTFFQCDLADRRASAELFDSGQFDTVVHLAAQAGVRYSMQMWSDSSTCWRVAARQV